MGLGRSFVVLSFYPPQAHVCYLFNKEKKMTDRSRYSNVSLSHATYEVLKKLSSKLLPGNTTLSLSKTVETLALEKMQNITNQNGEYKND